MVSPSKQRATVDIGKARISKSGQITIPVEIRRELELEIGDTVIYGRNHDGQVTIRKPRTAAQLASIATQLPDGLAVSEIIEDMDRTPMVRTRYQEGNEGADVN